jgi:hypothetical protein
MTIWNSELPLLHGDGRHLVNIEWRLAELRTRPKRLRRAYSRRLLLEAHWLGLSWLLISGLQRIDLVMLDHCRLLVVLLLLLVLLLLVLLLLVLLVLLLVLLLLLLMKLLVLLLLLLAHAGLLELHRGSLGHLLNHLLRLLRLWTPSI